MHCQQILLQTARLTLFWSVLIVLIVLSDGQDEVTERQACSKLCGQFMDGGQTSSVRDQRRNSWANAKPVSSDFRPTAYGKHPASGRMMMDDSADDRPFRHHDKRQKLFNSWQHNKNTVPSNFKPTAYIADKYRY